VTATLDFSCVQKKTIFQNLIRCVMKLVSNKK